MSITASSENPSSGYSANIYIQAYDDLGNAFGSEYIVTTGNTKQLTHKVTRNGKLYYKISGYSSGSIYKYIFEVSKP